jgi:rhodanese-related sulfurtransferase
MKEGFVNVRRDSSHVAAVSSRLGRMRVAAAIALAGLAATACGGTADVEPVANADSVPVAHASVDAPAFGRVSATAAGTLATDSAVTIIDVRTPEEFAAGHLEGATLIDFSGASFAAELAALDPDGTYLVYCQSGNRSGQTVPMLAELGVDRVYDLDGGILAWNAAGLPIAP